MANVWLARVREKKGARKLFAIKTIRPYVADDPLFRTMFLDEARIASRIVHPNVVRMMAVGEFESIPYLVMDLIEGVPLHSLPRACEKANRRLPLGVLLRIIADACKGLHAAHQVCDDEGRPLDIVHRDMSPQNILVSTAGIARVIDFGVAKAVDRATAQTNAGTLKGKITYMPQEQACGGAVDRRTDTWALGAVLYYMLAGRPPYKDDSQLATLQLVMTGAPIPPLPEAMPLPLSKLVMRALAHDPAERFQTAAELGDALEALMRRLGIVTLHADVGLFVCQTVAEELEAQRRLIAQAVANATSRELSEPDLDEEEATDETVVAPPSKADRSTAVDLMSEMETRRISRAASPDEETAPATDPSPGDPVFGDPLPIDPLVDPIMLAPPPPTPEAFAVPHVPQPEPFVQPAHSAPRQQVLPPTWTAPPEPTAGAFVASAAEKPTSTRPSPARRRGPSALIASLIGIAVGATVFVVRGHHRLLVSSGDAVLPGRAVTELPSPPSSSPPSPAHSAAPGAIPTAVVSIAPVARIVPDAPKPEAVAIATAIASASPPPAPTAPRGRRTPPAIAAGVTPAAPPPVARPAPPKPTTPSKKRDDEAGF
jgi:hypothetical protein